MEKTIVIALTGHESRYRLDEDAYDRLAGYLDRATARLHDDPDHEEVVRDLERSIGDKLAAMLDPEDRVFSAADVGGVLEAIGSIDTGRPPDRDDGAAPPRPRRLRRIREGQQIAGVCTGLAAYSDIDVSWVRTLFVLGTLVTAGILGLVYIALAFILPIAPTRQA
jgi:phage shock protein PspC (stress-responsive transcriptional regulator)